MSLSCSADLPVGVRPDANTRLRGHRLTGRLCSDVSGGYGPRMGVLAQPGESRHCCAPSNSMQLAARHSRAL
jgi:hypothetical protein